MKAKPLEDITLLTIESDSVRVGVDEATGWVRSLAWKTAGGETDLFAETRRPIEGYIGGVRIFDEVTRTWYDDFAGKFAVEWSRKDAGALAFEKRFEGAPFVVTVSLSLDGDRLAWDVSARHAEGEVGDRQLKVVFFLPLIAGWRVWAPAVRTPFTFDGMSSWEYMYNQGPYVGEREIMVPAVSHYDAKADAGFTLCEHIERNVPACKF
ncbi:MAG: hypothetical protein ACYTKD_16515 [Planctomycetota bacterium]|jgi:hypothetical protein